MVSKRGFEFSFAWIFAIIVGAAILFLAVFAATRFVSVERHVQDTEVGKEIGILLNPVETSLEDSKVAKIKTPLETRIYNDCSSQGNFGSQKISAATKSGVGETWQNPGVPSSFHNKYIFSKDFVEGKEFVIFTKKFEFPFKIADLMFIYSVGESYCFINPPREIEEEVTDLTLEGVQIAADISECSRESEKVCFTRSGCDIDVNLNSKSVKKDEGRKTVFYESELIYGAIFATPEIYECQAKRLMSRASELALLNSGKSDYLSSGNCESVRLQPLLITFANSTQQMQESLELRQIALISENLRRENENLGCRLF